MGVFVYLLDGLSVMELVVAGRRRHSETFMGNRGREQGGPARGRAVPPGRSKKLGLGLELDGRRERILVQYLL